jgi:hypothetical protein
VLGVDVSDELVVVFANGPYPFVYIYPTTRATRRIMAPNATMRRYFAWWLDRSIFIGLFVYSYTTHYVTINVIYSQENGSELLGNVGFFTKLSVRVFECEFFTPLPCVFTKFLVKFGVVK